MIDLQIKKYQVSLIIIKSKDNVSKENSFSSGESIPYHGLKGFHQTCKTLYNTRKGKQNLDNKTIVKG